MKILLINLFSDIFKKYKLFIFFNEIFCIRSEAYKSLIN